MYLSLPMRNYFKQAQQRQFSKQNCCSHNQKFASPMSTQLNEILPVCVDFYVAIGYTKLKLGTTDYHPRVIVTMCR